MKKLRFVGTFRYGRLEGEAVVLDASGHVKARGIWHNGVMVSAIEDEDSGSSGSNSTTKAQPKQGSTTKTKTTKQPERRQSMLSSVVSTIRGILSFGRHSRKIKSEGKSSSSSRSRSSKGTRRSRKRFGGFFMGR